MTLQRFGAMTVFLAAALCGCTRRNPVTAPAAPAPQEPQNVFVLLADADNHVGRVVVSNSAGSQELDKAGAATRVLNSSTAPIPPFQMDQQEVTRIFGEALAAQPAPPAHFTLHFQTNSTQLDDESLKLIPEIIRVIRERASNDISVVGHTDTTGDRDLNDRLSLRRARAIADKLIEAGVDQSALEVTAHGKNNPLVPTGDGVAEPRNRRVEISVR